MYSQLGVMGEVRATTLPDDSSVRYQRILGGDWFSRLLTASAILLFLTYIHVPYPFIAAVTVTLAVASIVIQPQSGLYFIGFVLPFMGADTLGGRIGFSHVLIVVLWLSLLVSVLSGTLGLRKTVQGPLVLLVALAVCWAITVSAFRGVFVVPNALIGLFFLGGLSTFFLVTQCIRTSQQLKSLLRSIVLGSGLAAAIATMAYFNVYPVHLPHEITGRASGAELPRLIGFASNPNVVASLYVVSLPLALGLVLSDRGKWQIFEVFATLALVLALLLTFSRGAWIGLIAALLVFSVVVWGTNYTEAVRKRLLRGVTVKFICLILVTALILVLIGSQNQSPILDALQSRAGSVFLDDASESRKAISDAGISMIIDNPFGVGYRQFPAMTTQYGLGQESTSHNSYITYAAEAGILGGLALVGLVGLQVISLRMHPAFNGRAHIVYAAIFAACIAFWVRTAFTQVHHWALIWIIFGLLDVSLRMGKNENVGTAKNERHVGITNDQISSTIRLE